MNKALRSAVVGAAALGAVTALVPGAAATGEGQVGAAPPGVPWHACADQFLAVAGSVGPFLRR